MITISGIKKHTAGSDKPAFDFKGLSTDEKPTENIGINSLFLELDTFDFYYFTGTTWKKVGE